MYSERRRKSRARCGLPPRPDPNKQPDRAALWEQHARRYRHFEHLQPELPPVDTAVVEPRFWRRGRGMLSGDLCGYQLTTGQAAPFVLRSGASAVPNLNFSPSFVGPNKDDGQDQRL
jgi:hypothetical protein